MTGDIAWLTLAGLVLITLLTRSFFMLPERELQLPDWLRNSLRYAPIGALVAVVAPDILLVQGQWAGTWQNAKLIGAAAALAWLLWRRDMLGTILVGTGVMLICRLVLGW